MMLKVRCIAGMDILFSDYLGQCFADGGWGLHYVDPGCGERLHFVGRGALAAGDDRARMAHAASRGCGLAGDEADHRLLDVSLDVGGGRFFRGASDFTDQDDGLSFRVLIEQFERVDVGGSNDGIAADADRRRLADPALGELIDSLVSEGPGAGNNAYAALLVDTA